MSWSDQRKVNLAVALLPKDARDRYREQWAGELRDAAEVGIAESEIASGALSAAVRFARPLPSWLRATRPRHSLALALSAAVVSLSDAASLVPATDGSGVVHDPSSVASTPLISWIVVVPIFALVMILASRVASARERVMVALLAVATYLPLFRTRIDGIDNGADVDWISPGALTYAVAFGLVVVAIVLAWREYRLLRPARNPARLRLRMVRSSVAGLVVVVTVALCSIDEFARWASKAPYVWREPVTTANRADYDFWLTSKNAIEAMVAHTLLSWVIAGMILAIGVIAFGASRRATVRRTILLAAGVLSTALLSYGGTIIFLQIITTNSLNEVVPVSLVLTTARLGMIAIALVAIGGGKGASTGSATDQPLSVA
jgi:hypothetical protein